MYVNWEMKYEAGQFWYGVVVLSKGDGHPLGSSDWRNTPEDALNWLTHNYPTVSPENRYPR